MKVELLKPDADSRWAEYVNQAAGSTIYHSLHWREVFENSFGYKSFYFIAVDSANRICGVLPVFLVNGLKRRLVSVPFRDRGGPLGERGDTIVMLLGECIKLANELRCHYVEIKTIKALDKEVKVNLPYRETFYWINTYLRLQYDVNEFWQLINPKIKNKIRQAKNADLVFMDCSRSSDAIYLFYDIYIKAMKAMGVPPYPIKYFKLIHKYFMDSNEAKLFLIRKNNELLAGAVVFIHKDSVIYGYSAVRPEAKKYRCYDFLVWKLIEWSIENGYRIFDFGADSPLQEGLLYFKQKWNSVQERIPYYYYMQTDERIEQMDSSLGKYEIFKKLYGSLPMPIYRMSGSIFTKYLG
jgi:Acetyltransferase (GNAT) domain